MAQLQSTSITGSLNVSTSISGSTVQATSVTGSLSGDGLNVTNLDADNILNGTLTSDFGGTGFTSYTNGQLLIGRTSTGGFAKATLTAGTGISVTNGDGTITISNVSGDITAVNAGNGLTGGGVTGDVTLNVGAGTGILVAADSVSVNNSIVPFLTSSNTFSGINVFSNSSNQFTGSFVGNGTKLTLTSIDLESDGSGDAPGTSYDGTLPVVISYNSVGAAGLGAANTFTATNNFQTINCTTLIETSSREYKTNIQTIPSQLSQVKKLNPVSYNRIETNRKEIGLIAEEVNEIYPEFVANKGINYPKMVSVLVSAIKELSDKVDSQSEMIKNQQSEIENLKTRA